MPRSAPIGSPRLLFLFDVHKRGKDLTRYIGKILAKSLQNLLDEDYVTLEVLPGHTESFAGITRLWLG